MGFLEFRLGADTIIFDPALWFIYGPIKTNDHFYIALLTTDT